jgi:hypothetical protein
LGFDPASGQVQWTLNPTLTAAGPGGTQTPAYWGGAALLAPVLTDRHTLLLAVGSSYNNQLEDTNAAGAIAPALEEIHPSGALLYSCPLAVDPNGFYMDYLGGTALTHGRWLVARGIFTGVPRIEAYDVMGADLATHGWVTIGGNPGQSGAPR